VIPFRAAFFSLSVITGGTPVIGCFTDNIAVFLFHKGIVVFMIVPLIRAGVRDFDSLLNLLEKLKGKFLLSSSAPILRRFLLHNM
jgi:hypothetical protein